jgi:sulfur carrier protein ThiS
MSLVLPVGAQVADVLRELALPADRNVLIGLNGEAAQLEQVLEDGARIDLVPPIAGGASGLGAEPPLSPYSRRVI